MPVAKSDVLYVKFKQDSIFTVSRKRVDAMAKYFQQDATFVTHFALARLAEEIKSGRYAKASDVPIGDRPPTEEEWSLLAERSSAAMKGRTFRPAKTLEQVWGLKAG